MLAQVLAALEPVSGGIYVDGTFGAGGYTRAILGAAETRVFAFDRDPDAISAGGTLLAAFPGRLTLIEGRFSEMEDLLTRHGVAMVDGIALDVGVSSMQIDEAGRGFSFAKDGPLDMRMDKRGPSAADIVNAAETDHLTRIIGILGEENKARSIARAIAAARAAGPLMTTGDLVAAIERAAGRPRPDRIHPATRTFQALRIYTNRELEELGEALAAAERLLKPGGRLAVVTFHSLEDRIVKRFLTARSGAAPSASRHLPPSEELREPSFALLFKGHAAANDTEVRSNPRARSAKLRAAQRTHAAPFPYEPDELDIPRVAERRH
ncbi:16S rRNA (cytosine(1402)-N(4))-methyltransferase RsmH [soil metagenome]